MENADFLIKIRTLRNGTQYFEYKIGGDFFSEFGNSIVLDASLRVYVEIEKGSGWMRACCNVSGTVTTECDRCLEELVLPVDFSTKLSVKFARTGEEEDLSSDEMMIIDPSEGELDLKQYIYDYVCLNLPLQRVHPQGGCNERVMEMLRSMRGESVADEVKEEEPAESQATVEALLKKYQPKKGKR